MTKRKSMLKPSAFSWVALKAAIGAEKAIPVRIATGIASRIAGERRISRSIHESAQTDAHRRQEQCRLQERAEQRATERAAVRDQPVLEDMDGGRGHSVRLATRSGCDR